MEIIRPIIDRMQELEQQRSPVAFNDILLGVNVSELELKAILKKLVKDHRIQGVGVDRYVLLR